MLFLFINDLHMNSKIQTTITLSKKGVLRKKHLKYFETGFHIQQVTPQKGKLSPFTPQLKGKRIF